ncbi:sensor histidine kinase [Streptomyces sp. NBC_00237]|uniref:sensor histidine kinase n=1 Tax=Streptomyces sp. NBC_00237 TaxID=2975687 RepID=UPI00224DD1C4|nr:sensor histidine kinase [Streptomyces sp. NBC_00237]MCX5205179.1 sensor histidine kinase [Streptomyces sp. NBC_00237]
MHRFRPPRADLLLALAQTTVAVLLGQESVAQGRPALDLLGYALIGLVNLPGAFRTRAPVAVCLLVHAAWIVFITAGYWPVANSFGPMLAVYTVASLRPLRASAACTVLMGAIWVYAGLLDPRSSMPAVVAQALVWPAALWRFGVVARRSAKLARRLRAEQEERARREVGEERGRIARELHDVVAHHMSVISVQSGLAQFVFESDPPTARAALATIAGTSAEAMEEMRRMLRLLRAPDERDGVGVPDAPMPGLARLAEMVERVRAGGVPVELRVSGAERPLAPGVELCAYRVVQEALTNVLKHAPGAPTVVELRYGVHQVTVSVTNADPATGEGAIPARVPSGTGHGLIGMRERAKLYGGTISIGPHGGAGGYEVRLDLPTSPRAVRPEDDRTR